MIEGLFFLECEAQSCLRYVCLPQDVVQVVIHMYGIDKTDLEKAGNASIRKKI